MIERDQWRASFESRVEHISQRIYSTEVEKRKAKRRLKQIGKEFGLTFGSSERWFLLPGRQRQFYDAGQTIVRDYLVPGPQLPYDPGDVWCGLYSKRDRYMWAWVEGVSNYSEKLKPFLCGPEAFRDSSDIVDPVLIDKVLSECLSNASSDCFCGYRNARVIKEVLRNGETSRNLSKWVDASLISKGSRIIFTRSVIYGDGLSPPLKSLLLSGYMPLAYRKNVYQDTDVLPGNNLGAIFMVRYDTPAGCADYFFKNIDFMMQFLELPAMQHVLSSLRTSSHS
jgi:hypothetical protein